MDRLQELLADGIIDEVYSQLKTGKEAEVWLVSHHGEPVAAKLYKEREFRSFKNDAGYKEGRTVRNTRTQRAMDKGSKFGRQAAEEAWKSAEADALYALHKLGVRVPKPVLFYDGVLLMEVIGDAEGRVAPRLVEAGVTREHAGAMYRLMRGEIIKMLSHDWIHGDLSEFNILVGAHGPVIIDFPQVITAAKNSQSEQYFRRDLGNMLRFFGSIDPTLTTKHASDADEIWRAYVRRHLSPDFEPSGRAPQHQGPPRHGGAHHRGPGGGQQQPRGPGGPQQSRGPGGGPQQPRGPGGSQQRGPGGGPQQSRGPGGGPQQSRGPGGGPQQSRGPGGPQQSRGPGGGSQQPRGPGGPSRKGPEVSFRGQVTPSQPAAGHGARPSAGQEAPRGGGAHRRRPPRRF
ncbi:MAG: RIO1 family regulatory kinase/ATPase [Myxococcota bacterium]